MGEDKDNSGNRTLISGEFEIINLLRLLGKNREPLTMWQGKLEKTDKSSISFGLITALNQNQNFFKIIPCQENGPFSFHKNKGLSLYSPNRKLLFKAKFSATSKNFVTLHIPSKVSVLPPKLASQFNALGDKEAA